MNIPAMKLATNGTLETIATTPRVVRRLKKPVRLELIESKFTLKVPVYAKIINAADIIPIDKAIPEALLNICPAK